jgi:prepilin-type N-terminal cleavage/methylation domain-containing protein
VKTKKGFTLVELLVVISIIALLLAVLVPSLAKARELAKRMVCGTQVKQIGVGMAGYAGEYNDKMPWAGGQTADTDEPTIHPWLVYRTGHGEEDWFRDMGTSCVCGTMGKARPIRIACLFAAKLIPDAKIFYCPSNRAENRRYDSYISSAFGNAWGTPHQTYSLTHPSSDGKVNDWIRSGYDYYPIDRDRKTSEAFSLSTWKRIADARAPRITCRKFSKLSTSSPYLSDVICLDDNSNAGGKSQVVHRSGLKKTSSGDILVSAGINCLFSDNHVKFITDRQVVNHVNQNKIEKLFDNSVWNTFNTRKTEDEGEYLMYNIYTMIK